MYDEKIEFLRARLDEHKDVRARDARGMNPELAQWLQDDAEAKTSIIVRIAMHIDELDEPTNGQVSPRAVFARQVLESLRSRCRSRSQ